MNRDSVASLINQHYFGLLVLLRRKARDESLAKDVLNQALVTSLEHLRSGRVSDPSNIAGYVFQVALNHLRNHNRKAGERADRRADAVLIESVPADGGENPDEARLGRRVREVLSQLPTPRDREIVTRFYLDEEDKEAICRDLGLSPLHFDKVIFRARQRMRKLLEESGFQKADFLSVLIVCCA